MRVIAGTYRSRPLAAPRGMATRPTTDRLRETLFNVLAPHMEGARFADLYAGTGAVGIEALSRGAAHVTFVENAASAIAALRANLAALGIRGGFQLEQRSVPVVLRNLAARNAAAGNLAVRDPYFTLIYLDPPWEDAAAYTQSLNLLAASAAALLAPEAIVIAEHGRRGSATLADTYGALDRYRLLEQGDAALSFYRLKALPLK
ncbi:MAG TPA: 16S rRNA (guanine(966)-N(2))-methyltransferase RsmD [Acidobacteriaceae bacterium]|jgi:16S rRNA (guanine(966)-N(2))-methyltransferase RsmD